MSAESPLLLQVCTNDHPPFVDICQTYRSAGESLGCRVETVYLSPTRQAEPVPDAHYLGGVGSSQRALVREFRALVEGFASRPLLSVCHRYRAGRTLIASRIPSHSSVTVAHEFGLLARLQRRLGRRLFARHMHVAGVSPAVQQDLARTVPDALLLPNVINLPEFDAALHSREAALNRLGLDPQPDTLTIVVMGRLIPWKRPQLALAALAELGADAGVRLVFLGDGPLLASLRESSEGLPAHVLGFQPDARSLLNAFDALLQVSEDREAFGMVALEAMAAGLPVIAQRAPGPAFLLADDAYYSDPEPAAIAAVIRTLQSDLASGVATQRAQAARARVARDFSIAALATRLDDLLFQGRMD